MRGEDERGGGLFSYVDLEVRVPADHPLRPIRVLVDEALSALSADFERLYSRTGRPSIAPEKLLRALLLQAFYTIRSERQLMEQLDYNLLFRWFVGLSMDEPVWDATVYSKNRDRLVAGDVAARFLQAVLRRARVRRLLSDEHFSVDGTLIEAWASMKSFRRKDGGGGDPPAGRNAERDFRGERRSNATHASATDGDARLFRKGDGQSSRLCYSVSSSAKSSSRTAMRPTIAELRVEAPRRREPAARRQAARVARAPQPVRPAPRRAQRRAEREREAAPALAGRETHRGARPPIRDSPSPRAPPASAPSPRPRAPTPGRRSSRRRRSRRPCRSRRPRRHGAARAPATA